MKENLKVTVSGSVKVTKESGIILVKNSVMPSAKDLIRRAIAGNDKINYVEIYDGLVLKVKKPLLNYDVIVGSTNMVKFNFLIGELDYSGNADNLKLVSDTGIIFSEVGEVDLAKDNTQTINIEWTLTVNLI